MPNPVAGLRPSGKFARCFEPLRFAGRKHLLQVRLHQCAEISKDLADRFSEVFARRYAIYFCQRLVYGYIPKIGIQNAHPHSCRAEVSPQQLLRFLSASGAKCTGMFPSKALDSAGMANHLIQQTLPDLRTRRRSLNVSEYAASGIHTIVGSTPSQSLTYRTFESRFFRAAREGRWAGSDTTTLAEKSGSAQSSDFGSPGLRRVHWGENSLNRLPPQKAELVRSPAEPDGL